MATSDDTKQPQAPACALSATARTLVFGLAWSALMLLVLGFWLRSKYGETQRVLTNILLIAGAAAVGLTLWQAFTLWLKQQSADQKNATLEMQRRVFSYILMAAGLGLIVLACVLGIGKKAGGTYGFILENLGESIGVLLFGLISFGGGYLLAQPLQFNLGSAVEMLSQKLPLLKLIQVVLGAICLVTFIYLVFTNRAESGYLAWFPELAALLLMSILCFACLMWLNTGAIDVVGTRLFVLVFGGSVGMILFLYSFARAIAWRHDIFLGGIAAWQGDNAWHFWLCGYLQFVALALMFTSFNLARTDIRSSVSLRRVMYGYDTIVQGLLLVEMLAVLNVVIYALVPFTFDWTKSRGAYALSDSTKNMISKLKQEANVIVLMSQSDPVFRDIRTLLDNSQALSDKLKVTYISPDSEPNKYKDLAEIFPKLQPDSLLSRGGRGVLIVAGPIPKEAKEKAPPHAFISDSKLSEVDRPRTREGKPKRVFKGEAEIMREFKFLVQKETKQKVYVLQENDEPDIASQDPMVRRSFRADLNQLGLGALVERLGKDNFDVSGLSFAPELGADKGKGIVFVKEDPTDKKKHVPRDCETLIVTQPSKPLPAPTIDAIERYMDRGGKMLVCLDVISDDTYSKLINTGLEPLLKSMGVEVLDSFAVTVRVPLELNRASVVVAVPPRSSEHVMARQFAERSILMENSARVLQPAEAPGRFKAESILQVIERGDRGAIVESDVRVLARDLNRYVAALAETEKLRGKISQKPVPVAVAVSEGDKPRMVVVGDTEFLCNVGLRFAAQQLNHYSFVVSAMEWMAERESIGAVPKEQNSFSLDESVNTERMIYAPGWIMLVTLVSLGVGVWVVRRR
jgi:hypothetical protein